MAIDLSYIKTISGDDSVFIREMFEIFVEQVNEYCEKLPDLLQKEDYEQLSKVAHKATSTFAIVGMERDSKMLKDLEIKAKDKVDIESYAEIINSCVENAKKAIVEFEILLSKEELNDRNRSFK